jgi:hypothetical protein
MAATHPRRKKVKPAESATYVKTSLGNTLNLTNTNRENAELVLAMEASRLTCRQLVHRILQISGPYTSVELAAITREKYKHPYGQKTISNELRELTKLGVVVRVNGAYAIHNWMEIGA